MDKKTAITSLRIIPGGKDPKVKRATEDRAMAEFRARMADRVRLFDRPSQNAATCKPAAEERAFTDAEVRAYLVNKVRLFHS